MKSDADIRAAQERTMAVFQRRPEAALATNRAVATITDGLTCQFVQGDDTAIMDMPETLGGSDAGPTPGFYARASVAGCVAIGIKMTAARLGVHLTSLEVGIEMDFDNSAMFGMGEATAAPLVTRLDIRLGSDAGADVLEDLVETALKSDPYFLALRDPQAVETRVTVG